MVEAGESCSGHSADPPIGAPGAVLAVSDRRVATDVRAAECRILGPLQVLVDRQRVDIGGPQAERLLAALLLAEGRVVSIDALIDLLWPDPPRTARHQVHKTIAGLRRRRPGAIRTDGPGSPSASDPVPAVAETAGRHGQ